ncbi:MAG: Sapep family Mn(2+)-dependent dipeptidase [Bacillota bacterium]|nr:Sapep family Mn(2+)-dependent dipeptidase [Bacillota bacterium]
MTKPEPDTTLDFAALPAREAEMARLLARQIRIPSTKSAPAPGAPYGAETLRALEDFLAQGAADGFRVRNLDGHAGWIELGEDDPERPIVAAVCHLDVVPAGDWTDAFTPRLDGSVMTGRGSSDDKGSAVACYFALRDLREAGYRPDCRLRLILGLDEESGMNCMAHYNEVDEAPAAAFTADAGFPVIHAEKGLLQFQIHIPAAAADEGAEPGLRLVRVIAGSRPNVIPGSCRLLWQHADESIETCDVEGVQGHAAAPENGKNAISLAMDMAARRLAEAGQSDSLVTAYQDLIGLETDGSRLGIAGSDEVSGRLTMNVGLIDLDSSGVCLTCDIRYPVTWRLDDLLAKMRARVAGHGGEVHVIHHSDPLYLPKDHPLVATLTEVYRAAGGENTEPMAMGGGTYARSLPNTVAFGPGFPGEDGGAHQTGESVNLASLNRARQIYTTAFRALDRIYRRS